MEKKICFLYINTTNTLFDDNSVILNETLDVNLSNDISKKKLYCFVRLIQLNYEIGYYDDNYKFITLKKNQKIVKPHCLAISNELLLHCNISENNLLTNSYSIDLIINEFKDDLNSYAVEILIGHNMTFNLKTLLAETIRYNLLLDLSKYIIIDIMNFNHNYEHTKLLDLFIKIRKLKNTDLLNTLDKNKDKLYMIKKIFIKLYLQYKKNVLESIN